jgi:hypothetical protein
MQYLHPEKSRTGSWTNSQFIQSPQITSRVGSVELSCFSFKSLPEVEQLDMVSQAGQSSFQCVYFEH